MKEVVIGVVTAPGSTEKTTKDIIAGLSDLAGTVIDEEVVWQVESKTHPLASSAEFISELFTNVEALRENNNWDMAIAISDLPSISSNKVVISEFDYGGKNSLISVPALGVFNRKKKLQNLMIHHLEVLYGSDDPAETSKVHSGFINRITKVTPSEESASNNRYILKSTTSGGIRLIAGMTYLNEPWTEVTNFKTIVALAFATGTYISIFRIPWELSLDYSLWRLIFLMIIAVFGMVTWLVYAHNLWEKRSTKNQPAYRRLYNFTTLMTLMSITLVNYLLVFLLLTISILIFVPMGLFETWTDADLDVKWIDYLNLIWFAASLGLLAGAFGSTAEEEEKIRNVTYSYRQMYRYRQLEKENRDKEMEVPEADKEEMHAGEEQTHEESEEGK